MMGLRFSATHPESPSPSGIFRSEQAEIVAADVLGDELVVVADVDGNGIVGDRALQAGRKHGERIAQAERIAQILTEFEQRLYFLTGGRNWREETFLVRNGRQGIIRLLEAGGRGAASFYFDFGGELAFHGARLLLRHALPLLIVILQNIDDLGVERDSRK